MAAIDLSAKGRAATGQGTGDTAYTVTPSPGAQQVHVYAQGSAGTFRYSTDDDAVILPGNQWVLVWSVGSALPTPGAILLAFSGNTTVDVRQS